MGSGSGVEEAAGEFNIQLKIQNLNTRTRAALWLCEGEGGLLQKYFPHCVAHQRQKTEEACAT